MSDEALLQWLEKAAGVLEIEPLGAREREAILDLARDVAHNVARPGAPLTAFLLGVAVGRGAEVQRTAEVLQRLATRAE